MQSQKFSGRNMTKKRGQTGHWSEKQDNKRTKQQPISTFLQLDASHAAPSGNDVLLGCP